MRLALTILGCAPLVAFSVGVLLDQQRTRRRNQARVADLAVLPNGIDERDEAFLEAEARRWQAGAYRRNFADSPANQRTPAPWVDGGEPA